MVADRDASPSACRAGNCPLSGKLMMFCSLPDSGCAWRESRTKPALFPRRSGSDGDIVMSRIV